MSDGYPRQIVPESVTEIERHAGLTGSEVRVLRLMERTPSKGYTASELAGALGAVFIFGKFLVSRDLSHLVKLGKIRVLKEKDGTWYFVAQAVHAAPGPGA